MGKENKVKVELNGKELGKAVENPTPAEAKTSDNENENLDNKTIPYDRFKQKVDEANALKKELDDFKAKQAEKEREELEEQNEFKTLYEQAKAENEALRVANLDAKKDALLKQAGYNDDQVAKMRKLVEGESDEELAQSIEELKATFPTKPKGVDPSPMNGEKDEPKVTDSDDLGMDVFQRIKNKIF